MHSSHFRQGFSILICINKKGHFVSVIERAWKAMRVKRVCKSCIREHSDNCPKFDLTSAGETTDYTGARDVKKIAITFA